jgi:hypothetical protein
MKPSLSRRDFLRAGSALVISFSLAPESRSAEAGAAPREPRQQSHAQRWLRVDANGVTIFTGKIELGQGIGPRWRRSRPTSSTSI